MKRGSPWHAVSIEAKDTSCDAARALKAKRFLSAAAPRLPLADCTLRNACPCAYKHHIDRRGKLRRKDETTGLKSSAKGTEERRKARGRRETDY